jgi:hypothetical protein
MVRNGRPAPVTRFLGTDKFGVLAIGSTANMEGRRRDFVTGLRNCTRNAEARLLHLIEVFSIFNQKYRGCSYEYSFRKSPSKFEARRLEIRWMKAYVKKFGEVPPLNSVLPGRPDLKSW